jgi:tetratricopeptide (TPR) repeat protein
MLSRLDPYASTGRDVMVSEVLDDAAARVGSFTNQPEVESALALTLGTSYRVLGEYAKANTHLRRALELREAQQPRSHEVAEVLLELAQLERDAGQLEVAEQTAADALAMERQVSGPGAHSVAVALDSLGQVLFAARKLSEAEARFREALAIAERAPASSGNDRAAILFDLARVQAALGRPVDARATCNLALANASGQRARALVARINELVAKLPSGP